MILPLVQISFISLFIPINNKLPNFMTSFKSTFIDSISIEVDFDSRTMLMLILKITVINLIVIEVKEPLVLIASNGISEK